MLDYEKLDVYRIALEFVVTTVEMQDRLPRGNGVPQDQFKRAFRRSHKFKAPYATFSIEGEITYSKVSLGLN